MKLIKIFTHSLTGGDKARCLQNSHLVAALAEILSDGQLFLGSRGKGGWERGRRVGGRESGG